MWKITRQYFNCLPKPNVSATKMFMVKNCTTKLFLRFIKTDGIILIERLCYFVMKPTLYPGRIFFLVLDGSKWTLQKVWCLPSYSEFHSLIWTNLQISVDLPLLLNPGKCSVNLDDVIRNWNNDDVMKCWPSIKVNWGNIWQK